MWIRVQCTGRQRSFFCVINGLAKASADSGSVITLKARGVKAYIKTGNTEKGIEIDDLEMKLTQDLLESPFEKIIAELYKTR